MPAPPRVLVVQPDERCPAGLFGEHLGRAGLACDVVPGPGTGAPGLLRAEHRGLLVLGGEMGATDDDRHPWLAATRTVVAAAVGVGRHALGAYGWIPLLTCAIVAACGLWVWLAALRRGRWAVASVREPGFDNVLHDGRLPALAAVLVVVLCLAEAVGGALGPR